MAIGGILKPRNKVVGYPNYRLIHLYYNDDKYLTTFWNTLSLLFPKGETFFINSVRNYRKQCPEYMQKYISAFIGQEAFHTREHISFNSLLGYDVDKELDYILSNLSKLPNSVQLAITCALEHFTALMGYQLLSDIKHRNSVKYGFGELWFWHAFEECEHRAVSFDVYDSCVDNYVLRVSIMFAVTVGFIATTLKFYLNNLRKQSLHSKVATGVALAKLALLFSKLTPHYLAYYLPNFHPMQLGNDYVTFCKESSLY